MQRNKEINLTYTGYGQAEARPVKNLLTGQTEASHDHGAVAMRNQIP